MANKVSVKHLQIGKSQSKMLLVIALSTALIVFGIFATKAIVTKGLYQRRALHARNEVASQLKDNYESAQSLFTQYKVFAEDNPNVLGGSIDGKSNLDGDNARIVLDALPSNYDAPALATSLEKILNGKTVTINSIKVIDDPVTNTDTAEATPKSKTIVFSFVGTTKYDNAAKLLQDFERSIRPFDLNVLELSGTDDNLKLSVGMTTYYQPPKSLDLKATKEVK